MVTTGTAIDQKKLSYAQIYSIPPIPSLVLQCWSRNNTDETSRIDTYVTVNPLGDALNKLTEKECPPHFNCRARLQLIYAELIKNAIASMGRRAKDDESYEGSLSMSCIIREGKLLFRIIDDGEGIERSIGNEEIESGEIPFSDGTTPHSNGDKYGLKRSLEDIRSIDPKGKLYLRGRVLKKGAVAGFELSLERLLYPPSD